MMVLHDVRVAIAFFLLANEPTCARTIEACFRRAYGTARGVRAALAAAVAEGGIALAGGRYALVRGSAA